MKSGNGLGAFASEQAERVAHAAAAALGVTPTAAGFADVADDKLIEVMPSLTGLGCPVPGRQSEYRTGSSGRP